MKMKRSNIFVLAAAGVLLVSGFLAASSPSKGKGKISKRIVVGAEPASTLMPRPDVLAKLQRLDDPARRYTIEPTPIRGNVKARTRGEDDLFQEATTIMTRARPVPDARIQFFDWANREDSPVQIYGWSAFVHHVAPIPGGWSITLKVWPKVLGGAQVMSAYFEEYTWTKGGLNFVKGFGDPNTPGINIIR